MRREPAVVPAIPVTGQDARERALAGLRARWPETTVDLLEVVGPTPSFGWIFSVTPASTREAVASNAPELPRLVAVLRESGQVIGTARDYTPARFARACEGLLRLARLRGRDWCSTTAHGHGPFAFDVAAQAREAGITEISASPP